MRLGSTILYKKFQFLFTPYTPQKMTILAKFGHFGTFWYFLDFFWPPIPPKKNKKNTILAQFCHFGIFWHFWDFFLPPITPKKNQKMTILTKFGHFGTSWHCSDFFLPPIPPKNPKNDYFGKIWPFWHFLALFWGGGQNCQKKDNVI